MRSAPGLPARQRRDGRQSRALAPDPRRGLTATRRGASITGRSGVPALSKESKPASERARLRLHQARHTYASFMIAAGVNAKALSVFMGHSSIKVTFDLYGHLMPGTETEAAALLDAFLDPADD